jgi:DNA-binding transcriptional LysR family regulator
VNVTTLRTFLEILEAGNLNRAAERLNVTQSTVTTRLNMLEEQIGQKLVVRSKSGVALTSAGFKFQRYAELMLQLWRQAQHETALPVGFRSVLNIGCHHDLWAGAGRLWFDHIHSTQPEVALSTWAGDQREINRWLESGLVDCALCYAPTVREDQSARAIFSDELVLTTTDPQPHDALGQGYAYVDLGEEFRRRHAEAFPAVTTPRLTFGSSVWALDHLLKWGGSGYLPFRLALPEIAAGKLHRVSDAPVFHRVAYLVHNVGATRNWPWFEPSISILTDLAA